MDVASVLKSAQAAVREANIDDDLRAVAFEHAIRLMSPKRTSSETEKKVDDPEPPEIDPPHGLPNGGLGKLATYLETDPASLAGVFEDLDGDLQVNVSPSHLASTKRQMQEQLILLFVGGSTRGAYEQGWVSWAKVRAICALYDLDDSNLATHARQMEGLQLNPPNMKGKIEGVRLSMAGMEEFKDLFRKITSPIDD